MQTYLILIFRCLYYLQLHRLTRLSSIILPFVVVGAFRFFFDCLFLFLFLLFSNIASMINCGRLVCCSVSNSMLALRMRVWLPATLLFWCHPDFLINNNKNCIVQCNILRIAVGQGWPVGVAEESNQKEATTANWTCAFVFVYLMVSRAIFKKAATFIKACNERRQHQKLEKFGVQRFQ